jgi:hypothetical protein
MAKPPTSIFHHGHGTSSSPPSDSLTTSPRGQSTSTAQKSEVKSSGRNSMPRNSSSCPPRKHDFMADWDSDWDTLSQGIPGRNRRTKTDGRLNAWCFDMEEKMTQKTRTSIAPSSTPTPKVPEALRHRLHRGRLPAQPRPTATSRNDCWVGASEGFGFLSSHRFHDETWSLHMVLEFWVKATNGTLSHSKYSWMVLPPVRWQFHRFSSIAIWSKHACNI